MPIICQMDKDNVSVKRYHWEFLYRDPIPGMNAALRQWRKEAIVEQEFFTSQQQLYPKDGKYWKGLAKEQIRIQRACTLMLPWLGFPDNNQKVIVPGLWPLELVQELDHITRRLELEF